MLSEHDRTEGIAVKVLLALLAAVTIAAGAVWLRTMMDMPLRPHRGPLPPLTDEEQEVARRLQRHVHRLAGEIGERHMNRLPALQEAAGYIAAAFSADGLATSFQEFVVDDRRVVNVVAEIPAGEPGSEIVVAGAHYDTVPGSPGANDNGSGVAALLETARLLASSRPARTIRFIAFANEEPPFFQTTAMGSVVAARESKRKQERISAMLSLETLGYFNDAPGSQKYPPPLGLFYPARGDFIAFVADRSSARLLRSCISLFRSSTAFPSEGIAAPQAIPGVGWSDHWSYWQSGYDAVMVTDTAPYRYPDYHGAGDTPERIDYERTARVTVGLSRVILSLAGGTDIVGMP
jgi:hypothetical protein